MEKHSQKLWSFLSSDSMVHLFCTHVLFISHHVAMWSDLVLPVEASRIHRSLCLWSMHILYTQLFAYVSQWATCSCQSSWLQSFSCFRQRIATSHKYTSWTQTTDQTKIVPGDSHKASYLQLCILYSLWWEHETVYTSTSPDRPFFFKYVS